MKRRVRFAYWLFTHSRFARAAFVVAVWPVVFAVDRLRGVRTPARWSDGWRWAVTPGTPRTNGDTE